MLQLQADQTLETSIRIFYQPIVRLTDLRLDHVEVLARAVRIDGTLGGAEAVVDAMTNAERSMCLTTCIMQRAFTEYAAFSFAENDLRVAFNLPLDALLHPGLASRIETIRAGSGLSARNIRFELTERHPVRDIATAWSVISRMRDAGYDLALDDVTPGMPNLAALLGMPIRAIKLDRSIVANPAGSGQDFIRTMVAIASANRQDVIAEGIETKQMHDEMRGYGVTHGQGYLFARPLSAAALRRFLREPALT
jgi:EAL domain-containing protein (putative c-di-GMP-specific phosphodiesterase class I)